MGQTTCFPCSPGRFGESKGRTNCTACPIGWWTAEAGSFDCKKAEYNAIVLPGAVATVSVPEGSYIYGDDDGEFKACPSGWFEINRTCDQCVKGKFTSFSGATSCHRCETGKFADTAGSPKCMNCNEQNNEYADSEGAETCNICPSGFFSIGKACNDAAADSNLPVPTDVIIARRTARVWNTVQVTWKVNEGAIPSTGVVEVQWSSSSGFYEGNDTSTLRAIGNKVVLAVPDLRVAVTYARVRVVGSTNSNFGAWSANSKPWLSTSETACSAEGYYLNESDLVPSNWKCSECRLGAWCEGSVPWSGVVAMQGFWRDRDNHSHFEACESGSVACLGGCHPWNGM